LHRWPRIPSAIPVVCLILGLLTLQPLYGQTLKIVTFNLAPELRNSQILRVSDFNITGSGSFSQLFNLVIDNTTGVPTNAVLRFEFVSDYFSTMPIVEATTQPFVIPTGSHTFTYQNFRSGNIDYNPEVLKQLTDAILQTGRLPNGSYIFRVTIVDPPQPNEPQRSAEETLEISNPTTLDLISPGTSAGRGECPVLYGLLPQFKWDSNANRFIITVCEALPSNSSPEDVMQNQPRLQRRLLRDLDFFGSPSLIYPSGDLPLEYGKTYYWQIQAIIESPSGEVRLPSEIWCFHISSLTNPSAAIIFQQLRSLLENLIDANELEALFGEGGPLHGYTPTGGASLNGRPLDLSELLTQLRTHSFRVVSMQVE
jgi:hypothetical protein